MRGRAVGLGVRPEIPVDAGCVRAGRLSCLTGEVPAEVTSSLTSAADGPPGRSGWFARQLGAALRPAPRGFLAGPLAVALAAAAAVGLPVDRVGARPDKDELTFVGVTILDGLGGAPKSGSVSIKGGRVQLGTGGGRRIDIAGAFLAPGFIEASCRTGFTSRAAEVTREMTADVDVADLTNPRSSAFREAAFEGCTTVVMVPGTENLVGGLTQAYHAWTPEGRATPIAGAPKDLAITMGNAPATQTVRNFPPRRGPTTSIYARRPTTRMGVVWMLRQSFLAAKGVQPVPDDADLTHYKEVLDGKRKLRVQAHAIQDINAAMRLADEAGFSFSVEGAEEGYYVRDAMGKRKLTVLSGPLPSEVSGRGPDFTDTALMNARMLRDVGCSIVLTAGADGGRWLREQGMFATRYGFSREEALAALTSVPADLCGLKDRGRITNGAAADVVLWSGHPMLPTSRMLLVVVDGRVVFDRTTDKE